MQLKKLDTQQGVLDNLNHLIDAHNLQHQTANKKKTRRKKRMKKIKEKK